MTGQMDSTRQRPALQRRSRGLGLAELMIALTIMAMLLTSVATAFHASCKTVEENQKVATVTHNARIVLNRLMTQARQADWIIRDELDPEWVEDIALEPASFSGPELVEYELDAGVLWYHETTGGKLSSFAILGGDDGVTVNGFIIRFEEGTYHDEETDKDVTYVSRITADVDLDVEGNRFTVTASTNPRRSLPW